jgi:putative chitinase
LNAAAAIAVPQTPHDPCAITAMALLAACPLLKPDDAETHAQALEAAREIGDLTTPGRVRHFLAQCAEETGGFQRLVENFNYRSAEHLDATFSAIRDIGQARALMASGPQAVAAWVYAGRFGNGDARSMDGWSFRGRGYLEITFRDNYRWIGGLIDEPLEAEPERLARPAIAARAAAAYWRARGCNARADRDDVRAVTAAINPALEGLDQRTAFCGAFRRLYP